jgi:hypothetical protein
MTDKIKQKFLHTREHTCNKKISFNEEILYNVTNGNEYSEQLIGRTISIISSLSRKCSPVLHGKVNSHKPAGQGKQP